MEWEESFSKAVVALLSIRSRTIEHRVKHYGASY